MATIKSFSDLEQSKKLAEFLPLESADMIFVHTIDLEGDEHYDIDFRNKNPLFEDDVCSWSLAALLSVLPLIDLTMPQLIGTPKTLYRCIYNDDLKSHAYDNPVDACVAMIEKLHELKML